MITELLIVALLIIVNGALAMSELAVVSARSTRLKTMADQGSAGAATAIRLAENPGRFLSTVQIGITLVGVLSGAFSGATLGTRLTDWLIGRGVTPEWASTLGVGGVVVLLTYLSLIVGELVPKQIALKNPEAVASRVAQPMVWLSWIAAPVVWFLDISGRTMLWLLRVKDEGGAKVTEEEVRTLLAEARVEGVIESEEQDMLTGVMRLADRSAKALMTPRRAVEMIDLDDPQTRILSEIRRIGRPRIPVRRGDDVLGVLYLTDAFTAMAGGKPLDVSSLVRQVPVVSEHADAIDVIEMLRASPNHMALVYDEYGSFEGIITTGDILEAITGTFVETATDEPDIVTREDGSMLVSGWMPVDEFCERLAIPRSEAGDYETVAGLVLYQLRQIPKLGDHVDVAGWRVEVIDLDDRRIDKLLVSRLT